MRNRPESPANKGCPLVLVFRTKHGRHAVAAAQRFAQVNRPVNGIANAATFILPSLSPRLVLTPVYNCARIKLTAPGKGCKLWSISFSMHTGGSHDQEQDNEYDTRISRARKV